jgi:hypothetical protein
MQPSLPVPQQGLVQAQVPSSGKKCGSSCSVGAGFPCSGQCSSISQASSSAE